MILLIPCVNSGITHVGSISEPEADFQLAAVSLQAGQTVVMSEANSSEALRILYKVYTNCWHSYLFLCVF